MVEQFAESEEVFGAREYINSGGRWSEEAFNRLMEIMDESETNPLRINEAYIHQAQGMGAFTGLRITAEEQYLYGVLSQKPIEKTLSQQQLLAEVMLVMGNPNKRRDFICIYPNIDFKYSALQREASRPQEKSRPIAYAERVIFAYGQ